MQDKNKIHDDLKFKYCSPSFHHYVLLCGLVFSACTKTAPPVSLPPTLSLELSIRDPRGPWVHVGDLHGQVVVLVILGTFDAISQAVLVPIERITLRRREVAFVGVLAQPDADLFVDAFVSALSPSFTLGYDPDNRLLTGQTILGPITTVPTIVVLDREGHIVVRKEGFISERVLEQHIDEALSRVPSTRLTQPPLLGESLP